MIDGLERRLRHIHQQLEESVQVNAQFQRRITELEQATDTTPRSKGKGNSRASIKLTWREGEKAPRKINSSYNAGMDNTGTLYIRTYDMKVYCYTTSTFTWSQVPDCPTYECPSVIVNSLLTLVGGDKNSGVITNQLFSLTGEGSDRRWTEEFPPMPTKRSGTTALCIETTLIVVGGVNEDCPQLNTVEVLNTTTKQWSTAVDLPQPLSFPRGVVCAGHVYILGETNMLTCSLDALTQSGKSFLASIRNRGARVWKEVTAPPVTETTCVSIHDRLLAIGGMDSDEKPTTAIHIYNPTTDSWEVISHMGTPRWQCIAAVLANNQLMVVGGYTSQYTETDSVEFGYVE